ncbi:MAG: hypothetical protein N3H30_01875 [Candidatus Micrarchaeota archaeon]|nr:hypothetical protein [Candidatus Micrarchaeota archaeon]
MKKLALLLILLAVQAAFSVSPGHVKLLEPDEAVVAATDVVDIGLIGPGQTFSIMVSSKVDTGGKYGQGGNWDNLRAESLPEGWSASYSELGPQLKIHIKAPADAKEGKYRLALSVNDEGNREMIGEKVTFYVDVTISNNVVAVSAYPRELTVSAGSPARYTVTVVNPSTASDLFVVEGKGIAGWSFKKDVFVPGRSSSTLYYEIVNKDEEVIPITIKATSKSSDRITAEQGILLRTKSDPYNDIASVRNGLLLYPPFESLLYSFFYIAAAFM